MPGQSEMARVQGCRHCRAATWGQAQTANIHDGQRTAPQPAEAQKNPQMEKCTGKAGGTSSVPDGVHGVLVQPLGCFTQWKPGSGGAIEQDAPQVPVPCGPSHCQAQMEAEHPVASGLGSIGRATDGATMPALQNGHGLQSRLLFGENRAIPGDQEASGRDVAGQWTRILAGSGSGEEIVRFWTKSQAGRLGGARINGVCSGLLVVVHVPVNALGRGVCLWEVRIWFPGWFESLPSVQAEGQVGSGFWWHVCCRIAPACVGRLVTNPNMSKPSWVLGKITQFSAEELRFLPDSEARYGMQAPRIAAGFPLELLVTEPKQIFVGAKNPGIFGSRSKQTPVNCKKNCVILGWGGRGMLNWRTKQRLRNVWY
ncbi:hypothetical protein B0H17DRAFT_1135712 [Mycena rosella]|uniref:Uncharacterized protein n=1 Tax=Mycena rosella TaxID=1033263 RepID=A0AAD7DC80_MYCRO|nr:hypothetical protein B0H17DRAFT_1135712 [Mycena rosella]